ncbi:hypothetical protein WI81_18905 [Burkholderia ubonensis]|nr:hypothetical protein WI81_18905 [Burkholderia ubonensis]
MFRALCAIAAPPDGIFVILMKASVRHLLANVLLPARDDFCVATDVITIDEEDTHVTGTQIPESHKVVEI